MAAVEGKHQGQEIDEAYEVLPGGDGKRSVVADNLDEQQRVDDGDDDCSCEEKESFGVALQRLAPGNKYKDAPQREHHANDELKADVLPVSYPHAEGDEERYCRNDHRGEAAADELHA